jgi:hypothetical protein
MEIAVMTGFPAERDMYVNACHVRKWIILVSERWQI